MLLCPTCGRRFREPRCPVHGAPLQLAPTVLPATWPEIPGYRLLGVLGHGGFGTVLAAEGDAGRVAIKLAHRGNVPAEARLRREAAALQAIGPPHVPRLYQAGDLADGTPYVVMELLTMPTLADRLADQPSIPLDEATGIARAVLVALAAAHTLGFVHRDLKPENIFVGGSDAKIVDFGLVKQLGSQHEGLTAIGAIVGSAMYMSPEQSAGRSDIDERSDIYSLGVILYEMLAGRPPFVGASAQVLQAHLSRRPPRLSTLASVPAAIDELVHRCLAKAREERPAHTAEVLAALDHTSSGSQASVAAVAQSPPPVLGGGTTLEKHTVSLLFFRATADSHSMQALAASFGGQLARADGSFVAVVFDQESSENPTRRALLAAQAVVDRGIASTAVVDTAPVSALPRRQGSRRYVSPLFMREDCFPAAADLPGVLLTPASSELIGDVAKEPAGRGLLQVTRASAGASRQQSLIGRDAEISDLVATARAAAAGRPTVATVLGESGLGKSHLLGALVEKLRQEMPQAQFFELRAPEVVGGHAGTLRSLMQLVLELPAEVPADRGHSLLAERLGFALAEEVWPGVAVALGWASAGDTDVRALAAAPGALRSAAARALGMGLRQRAYERPVVVILDDAHKADEASLDALELATLSEVGAALWVAVAARPSFLDARPGWGDRAAVHHRLELTPLETGVAGELCRRLLQPAEDIPAALIERLVARTRGLPLFLVELVRGLKREGLVRQHAKGRTWYLASDGLELPDLPLIEWLASREIAGLPPELARHAQLLALLGSDFGRAEVSGVLAEVDRAGLGAEFPLDATVATDRLVAGGLLLEHPDRRRSFRSTVVRDAVIHGAPPALAPMIHEAAYRFYQSAGDPSYLPSLAYHAARCGRHAESLASYVTLARDAEARHAYLDAEIFYTRALDEQQHAPSQEPLIGVLRGRGLMRFRLFRYDDALRDLEHARKMATERGDRATEIGIYLDEATALHWLEEYQRSRDIAETTQALAHNLEGGPGALLEARLTLALGRSAQCFSNDAEAVRLLLDAAARAEVLGAEGYETFVISLLLAGCVLASLGRFDESEAVFARVIPLVASRGDKMHLGTALANRFILWASLNQPERMQADLKQVLEIAREIGNARLECLGHQLLALSFHWLGESGEAEAHVRRALELDERRLGGAARMEGRVFLARLMAERGDLDAATELLADIRARQKAARARGSRDAELLPADEVMFDMAELLVQGGSPAAWQDLVLKAPKHLTGPDLAEVLRVAAARARHSS